MKIAAIVQARMTSTRFPGKVLHPVAGQPLLGYLLDRLERCRGLAGLVVATSFGASDDPVADYCRDRRVDCHRGPLLDVAGRFREVLDVYAFDGFVRVNGDSPLLDHHLIERALAHFQVSGADLVSNVVRRSYPRGQSVEVVRGDAFRRAYAGMDEPDDFEHVTRYFYRNPDDYRILSFESPHDDSGVRLVVDTPEDMDRFTAIVSRMDRPHWQYDLPEILRLYQSVMGQQTASAA
jgi:spore coat polysaccharide biosynthesis protein SpsF